jgi:hypothetical protein
LNNLNKSLLAILVCCFFTFCVHSKVAKQTDIQIIGVYSQKYKGGLKGTPNGIKYKIVFIAPAANSEFSAVGFWVNEKFAPAQAFKTQIGANRSQFVAGDTLMVSANFVKSGENYVYQDADIQLKKPDTFNNKVIFSFKLNNKQKYFGTDKIIELEEELRP